ncbi:PAS domain-containing sensor histidine kinase [Xanthovirga aplysinae]|uniref:PAS domain-containing sensor histidine kinase n=1 Tax=Xanthovirga aplysinae TaxID=2529853 RepID=UPI0012BC2901|nr:PAS domain-containing sensor histidine kinase [Xanthovirga aplysinae]MTI32447.1 PAS domain-containing sensor histidine kinase [Xanthovirga aplysinae]
MNTPLRTRKTKATSGIYNYFHWVYTIALSVVGIISLVSYFKIQNSLQKQQEYTQIIHITSKQSILIHKIEKTASKIQAEGLSQEKKEYLFSAANLFQEQYNQLINIRLPENFGDQINKVTTLHTTIYEACLKIEKGIDIKEQVANILTHEEDFLKEIDLLNQELEVLSNQRINQSQIIALRFSLIIFTALIIIGVFIFFPIFRKLKKDLLKMIDSEKKSQEAATALSELNTSLEEMHKEIKDMSFALDAATILIKTTSSGIITYANKKYSEISKYPIEELIGKKLFENLLTGEESKVYQFINDPNKHENAWQSEIRDHDKDGSYFWLDVTLIPIKSPSGEIYQYLVICSEITQRKQAEAELARLNQQQLQHQKDEQRIASYAIISGQEKERKRMSFEIHDGIGQMLTGLKFVIESIEAVNEKQTYCIKEAKKQLQNIIKEIRRISSDLLPPVLNDFGLEASIKEFIQNLKKNNEVEILLNSNLMLDARLDKNIEINLYRIVQESVNNALKHAETSRIIVSIENDAEYLNLNVQDNGIGFDSKEKLKTRGRRDMGNGLANMVERVELIGGKLMINSTKDKGSSIFVEVPLDKESYEKY